MTINAAKSYTLFGIAFGVAFPVLATAIQCREQFGQIDWAGIVAIQSTNPLLAIIDTAPIFLGLFAYFAGLRQDRIEAINQDLESRVREQTQGLRDANGQLQREIEVRVAREGELVEAYEEAAAGTRAKDKFVSNISHELRTPLNGIIGMTNELLESDPTPTQRESLRIVSYSAHNLLVIINDMLDLAKATANKLELAPRDFAPAELLQSVQAAVRTKVAEKNLEFAIELAQPLPARLHGDPVRLSQILLNLVGNAVKFTDRGRVTLRILTLRRTATECELEIRVCDTGIGISAEHHQRIFDDFAQAHTHIASKYGGTGLGLAITRRLVSLHGGELQFESTPGRGSEFFFRLTLPIVDSPAEPVSPLPSARPATAGRRSTVAAVADPADELQIDLRVLLVEDHPVNQIVAKAFLKRFGLPHDLAQNGREAVAMAEAQPYDLILMDIHLPEMDGLEATRRIRASHVKHARSARIIALTASALQDEVQSCLDAGMDAFIAKPFKPEDLHQTIVRVLRAPTPSARNATSVVRPAVTSG